MKKATLTIGLFSLIMVLTSFTTPETNTSKIADNTPIAIDGTGGQDTGRTRKVDFNGGTTKTVQTNLIVDIDGTGGQDTGRTRKVD